VDGLIDRIVRSAARFLLGIASTKPTFSACSFRAAVEALVAAAGRLTVGGPRWGIVGLLSAGASAYQSWLTMLRTISWEAHQANASLLGVVKRLLTRPPIDLHVTPIAVVAAAWIRPLWLIVATIPRDIGPIHLAIDGSITTGPSSFSWRCCCRRSDGCTTRRSPQDRSSHLSSWRRDQPGLSR
jgi:hypothetical protein